MELSTLVTAVQSNDISAWDELYNTTYEYTYRYARRLTANHEDAEDLAQKAYIKAYRSINNLDNPEAFKSWMSKIILNEFLNDTSRFKNTISRAKNTVEFEEKNLDSAEAINQNFLPTYMVEQQETRQIIKDCIDCPPLPQRACIRLFHISHMSIADIATTLHCSQNTVKS